MLTRGSGDDLVKLSIKGTRAAHTVSKPLKCQGYLTEHSGWTLRGWRSDGRSHTPSVFTTFLLLFTRPARASPCPRLGRVDHLGMAGVPGQRHGGPASHGGRPDLRPSVRALHTCRHCRRG